MHVQVAGTAVFRNAFTSGSMGANPFFNPFDLAFKNIANTCVLHWNNKLYALWEVGGSALPPICGLHCAWVGHARFLLSTIRGPAAPL